MNVVEKELKEFKMEKANQKAISKASWRDLFTKRHLVRALIVAVVIRVSPQLSGFVDISF